jgi:hypothetical protein
MIVTYLPDFRHTVFVDGDLGIDPSSGIAVPVPDTTNVGTSLHNLALEALLAEFVHQVDAAKTGAYNHNIGLELFCIVLVIRIRRFVRRTDVCPKVDHCGRSDSGMKRRL